jgi:ubiquinone/menaquinone biosynthesis C-methylase UbiE
MENIHLHTSAGSSPDSIDISEYKANLKATFDITSGYDGNPLRFFKNSAEFFASLLSLQGNEHVIDVATGTGHAALALSSRLPHGRITAVDFSASMLDIARKKTAARNIKNIEFLEMDMQDLNFKEASFDAAVCAFGIFFAPDMDAQLAHIASRVKPGCQVAMCSFQENYFYPLRDWAGKRMVEYGAAAPPPLWKRTATEEGCRDLFNHAGIKNVRVEKANMGYFLRNEFEWWHIISNTGMRRMIDQLMPENRIKFREEHMQEIAGLSTKDGIWLDVGVLYTIGIK